MKVDVYSCDTKKCDPQLVTKQVGGRTYVGVKLKFHECEGLVDNYVILWADDLPALHVLGICIHDKILSHIQNTASEALAVYG